MAKETDDTELRAAAGELSLPEIQKYPRLYKAALDFARQGVSWERAKDRFAVYFPGWLAHQVYFANVVFYLQTAEARERGEGV